MNPVCQDRAVFGGIPADSIEKEEKSAEKGRISQSGL